MKYLVCIFALTFIVSCSKNDRLENPLDGTWVLVSYWGFMNIVEFESSENEVSFTFNTSTQILKVKNNHTGDLILPATGKYKYSEKPDKICIKDEEFMLNRSNFDFKVNDENLTLSDNPGSDGPLLTFTRK